MLERKGMVEVISSLEAERPQDPVRHPHGRVGHGRGRDRVHPQLLRGIQRPHRPERALLHALQALAPDRPRGRHVGRERRAARRGDRRRRPAGTPTSSPPPSATCSPASCSTAKAATRSGASCCRPRRRRACGGLPLGLAHDVKVVRAGEEGPEPVLGRRGDGHRDARPTRCAARWSRCSPRRCLKTA